jgi:hypothetical protein
VTQVNIANQTSGTYSVTVKAFKGTNVSNASAAHSVTVQGGTAAKMYIGARGARELTWNGGPVTNPNITPPVTLIKAFNYSQSTIGPGLTMSKMFYSTGVNLPTSYTQTAELVSMINAGHTIFLTYRSTNPTTNLASFVNSLPSDRPIWLIYWHEVEGNNAHLEPGVFIPRFREFADVVYANRGNKRIYTTYNAASYPYSAGRYTWGDYYPGSAYTDWVTVDIYNTVSPAVPLQNQARFMDFYNWVRSTGKPWGVSERGVNDSHGAGANVGPCITSEFNWLLDNGCQMYMYWDTSNDADWCISRHPSEAAAHSAVIAGRSKKDW